jgi:hypothetical protein
LKFKLDDLVKSQEISLPWWEGIKGRGRMRQRIDTYCSLDSGYNKMVAIRLLSSIQNQVSSICNYKLHFNIQHPESRIKDLQLQVALNYAFQEKLFAGRSGMD